MSQALPNDFTPLETALIHFYYGLFGDQWRLITDILNYHPLTKGKMRNKDYIQQVWL